MYVSKWWTLFIAEAPPSTELRNHDANTHTHSDGEGVEYKGGTMDVGLNCGCWYKRGCFGEWIQDFVLHKSLSYSICVLCLIGNYWNTSRFVSHFQLSYEWYRNLIINWTYCLVKLQKRLIKGIWNFLQAQEKGCNFFPTAWQILENLKFYVVAYDFIDSLRL